MRNIKKNQKILVIRPHRQTCEAFYKKFKHLEVNYLNIGRVYNLSFYLIKGLRRFVKNTDVVCISDNYYSYNFQAVFWAKFYKKPIVTILWATIPNHISSWLFPYSFVSKYVVKNTDLFILRNKTAISFARSIGAPNHKIKVIYKGVDLEHFYPKKIFTENRVLINILYVGKLTQSKGILDLVEVFQKLCNKHKNIKLILAGEGILKKLIVNKYKKLPISLLGNVDYKDLADIYRKGDIFCSPSRVISIFGIKIWEEYFSYTLMEAQASGLPIVATNMGGIPEEVDNSNLLLRPGDRDGLYKALDNLIKNSDLRKKLSGINRKRAEKYFDAQKQAEKTEIEILKLC